MRRFALAIVLFVVALAAYLGLLDHRAVGQQGYAGEFVVAVMLMLGALGVAGRLRI